MSAFRYTIVDDFFPHLPPVLEQLKARDHWTSGDHPERPSVGSWPGKRSLDYAISDPVLTSLFFTLADTCIPHRLDRVNLYTHWRYGQDEDWIHQDGGLCTALVYLSETNLDSGTQFFDKPPEAGGKVILDVPFVQNRFVLFSGNPLHCSKANYGESEDNARFTMNFFAY